MILAIEIVFWASLAALVWTHLGYPVAVAALARVRPRPPRRADILPSVTLIVPAHNEEDVIERKLENVLALDYPPEQLDVVVTSDASTDATHAIVGRFADRGVRLIECERGGKVAAQDRAVRETTGEIVAFGDANVEWEPEALRELVAPFADPQVGMACGHVRLVNPSGGTNQEGVYWRYEMWLRARESLVHSMTGSNGAIYAVRRDAYREVDPRFGHDLSLPYVMVQRGRRAVYDAEAIARERPTPGIGTEYRRKVRMFEHCWLIVARGKMLRRQPPLYFAEIFSHRHLRYASGLLHLVVLGTNIALVSARAGWVYDVALGLQVAFVAVAFARPSIARYYALVTWATVVALWNYLRRGVPATWDAAEGTR